MSSVFCGSVEGAQFVALLLGVGGEGQNEKVPENLPHEQEGDYVAELLRILLHWSLRSVVSFGDFTQARLQRAVFSSN
jgi:hypothetical protein